MWLAGLMIFLAIAMILGPIMMMRPTPSVSRLASLRSLAGGEGMTVRLPSGTNNTKGAFYSLPLPKEWRNSQSFVEWHLERKSYNHDIHFCGYWDWVGEGRPPETAMESLRLFVDSVPDGIHQLDCNISGLGCLWDERCQGRSEKEAIAAIKNCLTGLSGLLAY